MKARVIHFSETPEAYCAHIDVRCGMPANPVPPKFKTNEWHRVTCKHCLKLAPSADRSEAAK